MKCHDRRYIFFWGGLCSGWGLLCFINQYKMLWNDRKKRPDRERERERDFRRAKLMAVSVCGGGRVTFSFLFFLVGPVGFARQYWVLDLFCLPSFFFVSAAGGTCGVVFLRWRRVETGTRNE